MPETCIHLFFGTAHPQKGVPRVSLQEGLQGSRWQTQEWWRQQQPQSFFQSHPQEGWQGDHCQLPGLECPLSHSRLQHAAADRGLLTTTSPRRMTGTDRKRQSTQARPKRAEGTRLARMGATAEQAPCRRPQACYTFQ